MGKGDIRTRRGKLFRGTYGNRRNRKKEKARKKRRGGKGQPQQQAAG